MVGSSREGFVVENLLSCLPTGATAWFYRTSAGAEIDLVIERNWQQRYAIEIKRSLSPSLSKSFYLGCDDIGATSRFVVYPGTERYPITKDITAISLTDMMQELRFNQ